MKNPVRTHIARLLLGFAIAWAGPLHAEDIDIFTAGGSGTAGAANIMFLVDNSANWARASQKWPDTSGNQGESELLALKNVMNSTSTSIPLNIGLAMYTQSGSTYGGMVRYGARDISVTANKTAFTNILDGIRADVNASNEKVAQNSGEAAALYEMYKYFSSKPIFRGGLQTGNDPASSLDVAGNSGGHTPYTTVGQGLSSGFAVSGGSYVAPVSATTSCGSSNYVVLIANNANGTYPAGDQTYEGVSAGASITGTTNSWTDEWARYLYRKGITVYVLDAYNAQNNAAYSSVLRSAAVNAGGKYFQVSNEKAIEVALEAIFAEIKSVNSTFAAASLPISATNRSQSLNQVFIGMFRPDQDAQPRWMGNLKRYQIVNSGSDVDLGDALGTPAINSQTGFVNDCAASYWTKDTGSYWSDVPITPVPSSACTIFPTVDGITGSIWSDLPDGPRVEKGGVAEVLRQGNNPTTTYTSPTWTSNRTIWTHSASSTTLTAFSTTSSGLSSTIVNWVKGSEDATAAVEKLSNGGTNTRPSIHGDVIHSRPLPVNYGTNGVTVFYGANDGMFRAVDASTGKERWALVAPEFYSKFQRMHDNSPLVSYPTIATDITPAPVAKDYFFDGSMGVYQNADNSSVWIFPSMRRGGRMIYALNVTDPATPSIKWRVGCPNAANDTGCTTGFTSMGQTWSTPAVAFLKGFSSTVPAVVVGGGYDKCEDTDSSSPSCSSRKGNAVYVINADTGAKLASFSTEGSVVADVAMSDVNNDGSVDYAYVVDTSGNIYRIDFSSTSGTPQAADDWRMRKIASTSGGGRKFLYAPALLYNSGKMYVALGSGDREHPLASNYPYANSVVNRFYVYMDTLSDPASSSTAATALDSDVGMQNFSTATICTTAGVTPSSGKKGWFMDLPNRGEQVITTALIAGGLVTFNTNRAMPASTNSCSASLGKSNGYWVNLLNASGAVGSDTASCGADRSAEFVAGGLTPSPTMATVLVDGVPKTVVIGAIKKNSGASSGIAPQIVKPSIKSRRKVLYMKTDAANN